MLYCDICFQMDPSSKQIASIWQFSFVMLATVVKITAYSFHTDSKLVLTIHIPCKDPTEGHCPTLSSVCFKFRRLQKVGLTSLLFSLQDESSDKNQLFRVGVDKKGQIWLQSSVSSQRKPVDLEITKNASFWHRFCLLTPSSNTHSVHAMLDGASQTVNTTRKGSPFNYQSVQDRRILIIFGGGVWKTENETYFEGCFKDVEFEVRSTRQVRYMLSINSTSAIDQKTFQRVCVTNETCSVSDRLKAQQSTTNCDCPDMTKTTSIADCPEVSSRGYGPNLWVVIVTIVLVTSVLIVTSLCCVHIVRRSRRSQQSRKHADRLANGQVAHQEKRKRDSQRNSFTCGSIAELEWDPQVENKVKNPELEWDPDAHDPEISDLCTADLDMFMEDENTVISLEREKSLEEDIM
ncbi:hypothetical protein HOLleu_22901 [Holothuria leucospilota]|uniref:Laminin G domain-containing protein n=1 Tax=Holothuria leucospilota TaxID=206669 RepID=A0A9Q1BTE1_HOLLE|nr:hypothetical protein HOLleu_22901 [Holothuria leucospilota]